MKTILIEKIDLRKAPGFPSGRFPALEGFCAGLNLVCGPNGSGKTTLSEALRRTIWDRREDGWEAQATAISDGGRWRLVLDGRVLSQTSEDGRSGLPGFPRGEPSLHNFPIVDLLQSAEDGSAFAARVRSELFFGVDLQKAADEAGKKASPTVPINAARALKGALRSLRDLRNAQMRGVDEKKRIDALGKEIDGLPALRRRLDLLRRASRLKENLEELGKLQAQEAQRPEALRRLSADSLALHRSHKKNLADRTRELEKATTKLDEVQRRLGASAVPPALATDPSAPEAIRQSVVRLQRLEANLASARKAYEQARREEEALASSYSWLGLDPAQEGLQEKLEALRRLAQSAERVRGALVLAQLKAESLREEGAAGGQEELESRLETARADERAILKALAGRGRTPALWAILGGAALAGIVASLASRSFLPLALAATVDALALLVWRPRPALPEETAARLGAVKPSEEDCRALLEKVREEARTLEEDIRRAGALQRAEQALQEARGRFEEWKAAHSEAAAALGLDERSASFETGCLFNFSSEIIAWRRASGRRAAAWDEAETARKEKEDEERRLRTRLGEEDSADLTIKAGLMIQALESRARDLQEKERLVEAIQSLSASEAEARRSLSLFWQALGLEEGDEAALERLAGEKEGYDALLRRIDNLKAETSPTEELSPFLEEDLASLEAEADALERKIEGIEDSKVAYGEMVQKHNDLISSERLAQAKAEADKAEAELLDRWEENAIALGLGIVERTVEEESSRREKPALLSKASAWLEDWTGGQHTIMFRQGRLVSHDRDRGRDYEIDELSSGTRVQLLMALRLASIEILEQGTAYPVFFDEVMANSDDERAGKLADAIARIARGRQVFYFTAQDDEVQRLLERCRALGTESRLVPLASGPAPSKARGHRERPARKWDFDCPYGSWMEKNGVSSGSLFDEAGSLPSWFLFFDAGALGACLEKGLEKVRQVAAAPTYKGSEAAAIAEALEEIRPLALKGRARKVTANVLNDFQAPNKEAGYWKAITAYVQEAVQVDGAELVAALEAGGTFKRVPDAFVQQLRSYLLETGHLADGPREDEALILDALRSRGAAPGVLRAAKRYLEVFDEP